MNKFKYTGKLEIIVDANTFEKKVVDFEFISVKVCTRYEIKTLAVQEVSKVEKDFVGVSGLLETNIINLMGG